MPPDDPAAGGPRSYVIRLTEPAEAEIEAAYLRLMRATSLGFADRWQEGLSEAVNGLALFPTAHEIVAESAHFQMPVRRLLYRLGRVAYRILFTLIDEDGDGHADMVRILHVRHGAQGPLSEASQDNEQN